MPKPKISVLVVDDNDMMRSLLRGILRSEDFEVVAEGNNGVRAVELAERFKPDVVCLDVMMPEMDGLAALKVIHSKFPATKVIMVTANASSWNVQTAVSSGASGFIVKPFNAAKVLDTLHRITNIPRKPKSPPPSPSADTPTPPAAD